MMAVPTHECLCSPKASRRAASGQFALAYSPVSLKNDWRLGRSAPALPSTAHRSTAGSIGPKHSRCLEHAEGETREPDKDQAETFTATEGAGLTTDLIITAFDLL